MKDRLILAAGIALTLLASSLIVLTEPLYRNPAPPPSQFIFDFHRI